MRRSDVVKRMWEIVRERDLQVSKIAYWWHIGGILVVYWWYIASASNCVVVHLIKFSGVPYNKMIKLGPQQEMLVLVSNIFARHQSRDIT